MQGERNKKKKNLQIAGENNSLCMRYRSIRIRAQAGEPRKNIYEIDKWNAQDS